MPGLNFRKIEENCMLCSHNIHSHQPPGKPRFEDRIPDTCDIDMGIISYGGSPTAMSLVCDEFELKVWPK